MTDENKPLTGKTDSDASKAESQVDSSEAPKRTEIKDLPPEIQSMIEELRRENAGHRVAKKKAEEAARKAEEEKLTAQAEWKTLAEQRAARLAELEKVAEQKDAIESAFNAGLEARLKAIPEDKRKRLVEPVRKTMSALEFSLWLDANEGDLKAQRPPNLDGGVASAANVKTVALTAEQIDIARRSGMTIEQYAQSLERMKRKENAT